MELFELSELKPYNACRVVSVAESEGDMRLTDLGVTRGAVLTRLYSAPCGEPTAYAVRGSVFALRKTDADRVKVCPLESLV